MEQNHFWEANSRSASQQFLAIDGTWRSITMLTDVRKWAHSQTDEFSPHPSELFSYDPLYE